MIVTYILAHDSFKIRLFGMGSRHAKNARSVYESGEWTVTECIDLEGWSIGAPTAQVDLSRLRGISSDVLTKSPISIARNDGLKALCRAVNSRFHQWRNTNGQYRRGMDLFAEDWDNCLILDACRYDMFIAASSLKGNVTSRQSPASCTRGFLRASLHNRDLTDTVYVSANPQIDKHSEKIDVTFHAIDRVWQDGWDDEAKTVRPEVITRRALQAVQDYPHKRVLIHYLQPHYPFLASNERFDKQGNIQEEGDMWRQFFDGDAEISQKKVWELYMENLKAALPSVREFLESVGGKTVVTSDHGNMVGERSFPIPIREWGHPPNLYTKHLTTVPWLEHTNRERKEIVKDPPARNPPSEHQDAEVSERLRDLGYV